MASLRCRVFASTAAKLGVAHNTGVRAVEEDVFDILILQVGALQDSLEVRFGEAWDGSDKGDFQVRTLQLTLRLDQDIGAVVETWRTRLICQAS